MEYKDIRQQVIDASLHSQKIGLIRGTSGNISLRSDDGKVIAITPSGIPYELLKPEDVPLVDENGSVLEGTTTPSSETPMHTAVLRARADVKAVVHTHAKYCTLLSIMGQELPVMTIPTIAYAPTPAPIVPFELPGSQSLGEAVVKGLGEKGNAVMMEYHGMLAVGATLDKAMACADYIEEAAELAYLLKLATGEVVGIDMGRIQKMMEILKSGRAL
ncbi:class II aldolase/adducin family protein [Eubacteriales bacterium OttesenSCG-928-N14]|nr:class II aldolase/adducin family protein [Eubacteriales bacterium OttesenSCG-928-N14]